MDAWSIPVYVIMIHTLSITHLIDSAISRDTLPQRAPDGRGAGALHMPIRRRSTADDANDTHVRDTTWDTCHVQHQTLLIVACSLILKCDCEQVCTVSVTVFVLTIDERVIRK